ncbi:universal stress protein [Desulfallas thermosapovorans]|uniref:Nucleotide-binding universal stress UspA family protein n=1 Tax=Desulfallas thermosapovorans DSM 6562 TaxID=1121431 RepID=A0A5S4ZPY7_9FIRM|nr:universal stress protein [Desulfallas thermosapovorans]TYO94731.1 nucleotide-binding universal stress UspA family protein [Desulfallas thermosapovorans DSM 6562]
MHVLVPVDGSDNAMRAVHYTVKLAGENPNIQVTVISVIHPFTESHAGIALEKARNAFMDAGLTVQIALMEGEPADTIIQYANEHDVDHIIMGSRGMGALKSMVLGSVSYKVLGKSDIPVTIIK